MANTTDPRPPAAEKANMADSVEITKNSPIAPPPPPAGMGVPGEPPFLPNPDIAPVDPHAGRGGAYIMGDDGKLIPVASK